MSFRIHAQDASPMHQIYQHHPRSVVKSDVDPVKPVPAPVAIKLVEPEVPKPKIEIKISAPLAAPLPPVIQQASNVINHPSEVVVVAPPMHDVVSSLAPVHVNRDSRSRSPSPAPVPVSEEVVMRIKRRNNK